MATLAEALAEFGVEILAQRILRPGRVQLTYRCKGRKGSIIANSATEAFEKLYERWGELCAEEGGLPREAGRIIAQEALKAVREEAPDATQAP